MIWKSLVSVGVAIVIIGAAWIFSNRQPSRVRIGHLPLAMHAPLFVAYESGQFRNRNLDVELVEYPSSDLLVKALLSDRVDIGYELGTDVVFNALVKDLSLLKIYQVSLSYKDTPSDYLLIAPDSKLKELSELRHKKLGLFPGPTANAFIKLAFAKAAKIDTSKEVFLTSLPPPLQIDALTAKQIDALFTYEPFASNALVAKKAKVLKAAPIEEYVIDPWPGGVGVLTKYFLARNPNAAAEVVDVLYQTFESLRKDPSSAQKVLANKFKIPPDAARRIHLTKHWTTFPTQISDVIDNVDRTHMDRLLHILVSERIVTSAFETSAIYYDPASKTRK